jgi:uncharacterized protein (TIGR02246 family)
MRRKHSAWIAAAATAAVVFTGSGTTYANDTHTQRPAQRSSAVAGAPLTSKWRIAALFDRWNAALASGDPYRVADLYAPDAVLLPTVSAKIRTNRAEIVDYFRHFLESEPVGRIQDRFIEFLGRNAAVDTGLYQFTLTNKDGSKRTVNARYTFVYERRHGQWRIINHHSSAVPTAG